MKCHKARLMISQLLDGELREKDRSQLQNHLESCKECLQLYEDIKSIRSSLASADSLEPSPKIWENLKDRLQAEVIPNLQPETSKLSKYQPTKKIFPWLKVPASALRYVAALFIFLFFIASAFYLGRHYQNRVQPELQIASKNPALQKIQEAESYYRQAIKSLTQAVESSNSGLAPEMTDILQANLSVLDRTIELCQQVVNEQPNNAQARDFLLSAYDSKLNFMNIMLETKKSLSSTGA